MSSNAVSSLELESNGLLPLDFVRPAHAVMASVTVASRHPTRAIRHVASSVLAVVGRLYEFSFSRPLQESITAFSSLAFKIGYNRQEQQATIRPRRIPQALPDMCASQLAQIKIRGGSKFAVKY